jgi:hypothetical protein
MRDLIRRTKNLLEQAKTEESHYYVASILQEWLNLAFPTPQKTMTVEEIEKILTSFVTHILWYHDKECGRIEDVAIIFASRFKELAYALRSSYGISKMKNCCKDFFDSNGLQGVLNEPMTICPYCGHKLTDKEFEYYDKKLGKIPKEEKVEYCEEKFKIGDEIIFSYPNFGYPHDQKMAKQKLKKGEVYIIKKIDEGNWKTDIYLEGIKGTFNSVLFSKPIKEQGIEELGLHFNKTSAIDQIVDKINEAIRTINKRG